MKEGIPTKKNQKKLIDVVVSSSRTNVIKSLTLWQSKLCSWESNTRNNAKFATVCAITNL